MMLRPDHGLTGHARLAAAVEAGLAASGTPGAAVVCARAGEPILEVSCGHANLATAEPMTVDAVADIASITKVATTLVAARLNASGVLPLHVPLSDLLPVSGPGVSGITVKHLLTHTSGHCDWLPLFLFATDREAALSYLAEMPPPSRPGTVTRYSDIGMMLLGEVVAHVGGAPLDRMIASEVTAPLQLERTGFGPRADATVATSDGNTVEQNMVAQRHPELVPLDPPGGWREHVLLGEANDANAHHAFGGVAGHAGLFSTARELTSLGCHLLAATRDERSEWLPGSLVRRWATPGADPRCGRGLLTRRVAMSCGPPPGLPGLPPRTAVHARDPSFGHRGFTGCELLVDPATQTVVSLVSNRLHGTRTPRAHSTLWRPILRAAGFNTKRLAR